MTGHRIHDVDLRPMWAILTAAATISDGGR